ncbi:unnamed protein product [Owenia fusiformis]|uniref:Uncharacterized protein n=1 Tax=Owenia fusiformis TaxID=6347 RepID=A0A8J1YD52_OWEFU|nr:unnamed protein product [Owenia fusiformis]
MTTSPKLLVFCMCLHSVTYVYSHDVDCSFYDTLEQSMGCGERGYLVGFGKHFCKEIQCKSWLMDREGEDWSKRVLRCMEERIDELQSHSCEDFTPENLLHSTCYFAEGDTCAVRKTARNRLAIWMLPWKRDKIWSGSKHAYFEANNMCCNPLDKTINVAGKKLKFIPQPIAPVYDDSRCTTGRGGSCMLISDDCEGSFISKQCGGPANRQCCIPTPSPSSNSAPFILRMTYELQIETCPTSLEETSKALKAVFTNILAELCQSCKFENTIKYCGSPTDEAIPKPVKRSTERVKREAGPKFETLIGALKSDTMVYSGSLEDLNNELKSYADRISTAITSTSISGITVTDTPIVFITSKEGKCVLYSDLTYELKTINRNGEMCIDEIGVCFTSGPFGMFPETPKNIELSMYLYTRESRESWNCLSPEFSTGITINPNKPTKVIVHGYNADGYDTTDWPHQMRRELLREGDYNVIIVDWSEGAEVKALKLSLGLLSIGIKQIGAGIVLTIQGIRELYGAAATNTQLVGHMIYSVLKQKNVNMGNVHCIGHSLGAHVCGFLGKSAGEKTIGRISGMDPAGPKFEGNNVEFRLDPSDAKFVDIIHTDTDIFGYLKQLGHVDFYPNGGRDQPGCFLIVCDHSVAIKLYLESIDQTCIFYSTQCSYSKINEKDGDICYNRTVDSCSMNVMGYYSDRFMDRHGAFYLKTNKNKPRCNFCVTTSPCDTTQGATEEYDDGKCECLKGTCKSVANGCNGGNFYTGKCGGPVDRKCCVPTYPNYNDVSCVSRQGVCKITTVETCNCGQFYSGLCDGPSHRQCCISE